MTGLFLGKRQSSARTSDGAATLRIVAQPEAQHRARYQTEGSRGAIKDKQGTGFPTVRIEGYNKPAKIQVFIGTDSGRAVPHMFYQVCRVTGKHSSPCQENKINGTDVIEILSDPINDNIVICDCIGILKERFADVEQRFPKHKNWKSNKKKSTKCRMVFRAAVETSSGSTEVLEVVSDIINCTQLPGTPEILKMSTNSSDFKGGNELWIIGKNFLKDTKVVFSHITPGKEEPLWTKVTDPESEFFHQTHLITKIPPFFSLDLPEPVEVSVYIKCGEKLSDPLPFTFHPPSPSSAAAPSSNGTTHNILLPKGVSAPAVAINQHFAKTGSVSVISKLCNGDSRDQTSHNHKNKKSKMDFNSKNSRRTRSVPRPNLVEEDTVFVTERPSKTDGSGGPGLGFTSFSQLSWKDNPPPVRNVTSVSSGQQENNCKQFDSNGGMRMRNSLSFTVDEDSRTYTRDNNPDDSTTTTTTTTTACNANSPPPGDFSSSLTRDFSGAFSFNSNQESTGPRLSFAGALMTQSTPKSQQPTTNNNYEQNGSQAITDNSRAWNSKVESILTIPENSTLNDVKPMETSESPNISVKASAEEKATISISLPTSILKDQKHFQNVIETINNTLLSKNGTEEEKSPEQTQSWLNTSSDQQNWISESPQQISPQSPGRGVITSLPVSVLSNARKRNISSELISQSQERPQELIISPQLMQETSTFPTLVPPVTDPVAGETAQEKKWNAEFNQVLQTVIEQERVSKSSMDWSTGNLSEQKTVKQPVMDWCAGESKAVDCLPPAAAAPSISSVPVLESEAVTSVTLLAQPVDSVAAVYCLPPASQASQEAAQDSQQPQPQVEADRTQDQLLFEVRTVNVVQTVSNNVVQDLAPIQGDPLLSEASACIELQKSIEAASVNGPEQPSLGSEIPRDQQWVNTPQTTDWS